jgi:hypothetical protein
MYWTLKHQNIIEIAQRHIFLSVPLPLCLVGPLRQAPSGYPRAPTLPLAAPWDPPVSSAFPAPTVDQHTRTRARSPSNSATLPAHAAQLLLSTARARTHFPIPFCIVSLSLALCPRCSASPETRARHAGHLARRRPRQATPSSASR